MEVILEAISIPRYSASRETTTFVEASGRLYSRRRQACLRGADGFFRMR
jgi:hypothetical protein